MRWPYGPSTPVPEPTQFRRWPLRVDSADRLWGRPLGRPRRRGPSPDARRTDSITVLPQPVGEMSVAGLSGCDVIATFAYSGMQPGRQYGRRALRSGRRPPRRPAFPLPVPQPAWHWLHRHGHGHDQRQDLPTPIRSTSTSPPSSRPKSACRTPVCMGTSVPLENLSTGVAPRRCWASPAVPGRGP